MVEQNSQVTAISPFSTMSAWSAAGQTQVAELRGARLLPIRRVAITP